MDFPKEYPRMLAVVAVVVDSRGRVLLHRRENEPDKGKWQLFGSYVKPGEQLVDAVKRCISKDGGISEVVDIRFTGRYYDAPGRHINSFCIPLAFKVVVDEHTSINTSDCAWFSAKEAGTLDLALDNKRVLSENL